MRVSGFESVFMECLLHSLKLSKSVIGSLNWSLGENIDASLLNTAVKLCNIIELLSEDSSGPDNLPESERQIIKGIGNNCSLWDAGKYKPWRSLQISWVVIVLYSLILKFCYNSSPIC